MIYRNGKKVGAIFRNGQSIGKIFRNGKLVWQKAKPATKRVKSITVALPDWGTPERIEWESILRAVPADIRNFYLDALVNGIGVRLRGYGGQHVGELSGDTVVLPDSLEVTTDDVYVGQVVSFVAKVPAVTSDYTRKSSSSSYCSDATYEFETAPFFPGSSINVELKVSSSLLRRLGSKLKWTIKGSLVSGTFAKISPSVTKSGSGGLSAKVVYTGDDYKAMATYEMATWMTVRPSFHITRSAVGKISKVTLQSPESRLTYKFKIKRIETY